MAWTTSQREAAFHPNAFIHVGNHIEDLKTIIKRLKSNLGGLREKKSNSIIPPTTGTNGGVVPEQAAVDV